MVYIQSLIILLITLVNMFPVTSCQHTSTTLHLSASMIYIAWLIATELIPLKSNMSDKK